MLQKGSIISLAKLPSFTPRTVFLVAGASDRTQKFPTSFEIKASSDPYLSDTYQTHFLLGDIFVKKIRMLSSIAVKLDMVLILIHKCYYCCVVKAAVGLKVVVAVPFLPCAKFMLYDNSAPA